MSSIIDFGADPTGRHDSLPAFQAAIDFLAPHPLSTVNVPNAYGGHINIPRGEYKLSDTLSINRSIHLVGETGSGRFPSSILTFETGGIEIVNANGVLHNRRGDFSILEHLGIYGAEEPNVHGVHMKAPAKLNHCRVRKFGGNGIFIDGRGDQPDARNCNGWQLCDVLSENNGEHGFYVQGQDSNAGGAMFCKAEGNAGWGYLDSSYFGGHAWVSCTAEVNGLGPFRAEGAANRVVFVGCYAEGVQPSYLGNLAIRIGGVGVWEGPGLDLATDNDFPSFTVRNTRGSIEIDVALGRDPNVAIRFGAEDDTHDNSLKYDNGRWHFVHADSITRSSLGVAGSQANIPPGSAFFLRGYYIGRGARERKVDIGRQADLPAAPISVGHRYLFSDPLAGGYEGMIGVEVSGAVSWKGFGRIET